MEVLFFIVFGGLILFFIGYGFWMVKQDKKIIDEYKSLENHRAANNADVTNNDKLLSDQLDIPKEDRVYICGEHPFIPYIESWN
jgi:hypothetical protein